MSGYNFLNQQNLEVLDYDTLYKKNGENPLINTTDEPTQEIDLTNVNVKSDFWRWFMIGGGALLAYYILKKV